MKFEITDALKNAMDKKRSKNIIMSIMVKSC